MNEFMLIFRSEATNVESTPEQIAASVEKWQTWIGDIIGQGKFVSTAQLKSEGRTVKADGMVSDGPYAEVKELVGGNLVVKTNTIEEAVELAHGCPVLQYGGNVEVRSLVKLNF